MPETEIERVNRLFIEYGADFGKFEGLEKEINIYLKDLRNSFLASNQFEAIHGKFITVTDLVEQYELWLKELFPDLYSNHFKPYLAKEWGLNRMSSEEAQRIGDDMEAETGKLSVILPPPANLHCILHEHPENGKLILSDQRSAGVGSPEDPVNPDETFRELVTAFDNGRPITVIDVSADLSSPTRTPFEGVKYEQTHLPDGNATAETKDEYKRMAGIINENLTGGNNVLIHCNAGQTRSPTVVITYLMIYKDMSYHDALKYVYEIRRIILIGPTQDTMLQEIERELSVDEQDLEPQPEQGYDDDDEQRAIQESKESRKVQINELIRTKRREIAEKNETLESDTSFSDEMLIGEMQKLFDEIGILSSELDGLSGGGKRKSKKIKSKKRKKRRKSKKRTKRTKRRKSKKRTKRR